MKKIIITAMAVFALTFANAQKAKFGIKGGLNIANLSYSGSDTAPDFKSYTGFHIGGLVECKLAEKIAIQPEILYSTQGAKFKADLDGMGEGDFAFKLNYINIPVMFKYFASKQFSLEAGPQIGFLTSAKTKADILGQNVEVDSKDMFNSTDFAFNFGAGYEFTESFFANLRYSLGLSNVAKTESGDDTKLKNNVFLISLGYKFK